MDPIDGTVNFAYGIPHACVSIQLSTYRGKWIVLCFYPGDFTFV